MFRKLTKYVGMFSLYRMAGEPSEDESWSSDGSNRAAWHEKMIIDRNLCR